MHDDPAPHAVREPAAEADPAPALVLLSGGLDSAVALWWALDRGHEATALTFHYHDRAPAEKEATRALADAASIPLVEAAVPDLREVADVADPPAGLADAPDAYVPHRNLVFYGLAAHHAERVGARVIVGGHNGVDPETFPDSGPAFFKRLNELVAMGRWPGSPGHLEVVNPLHGTTKADVLRRGLDLDVPLELTFSCGELVDEPCGTCPSCVERAEAFDEVGVGDPASDGRS